jgi:predicted O-linked N-acetylglucosamine transferase (SPINDLY family)
MKKILTEISAGELLDKISILEIKLNKIKDHVLLNEVKKEYEILNETKNKNINFSEKIDVLYKNLKETNKKLWEIENKIRLCEKNSDFKEKFIQISRDIYFANDRRSKIKLEINKILGSNIKEVKQYTEY